MRTDFGELVLDVSVAKGAHIARAAVDLVRLSNRLQMSVATVFNDILLRAEPGMLPTHIVERYNAELEGRLRRPKGAA